MQHNKTFDDMHTSNMDHSMTTGYTMEVKPVLDVGEDLFLNERFVAVCQVQNAGGIRRDFVRFVPRG